MHQNTKRRKIYPKSKETINTNPNHDNNNTQNDDNDKVDHNNNFDDKK